MNHIFRLVWSHVLNAWVAVAEKKRGRSKGSARNSGKLMRAAALAVAALAAAGVQAAPAAGQVVNGAGSIGQSGAITTITQGSQNLGLTWQSFNIAKQETVNFVQPNASAIAVNRIADVNGTQILGHLNANGQVFLINPNGFLFGAGAQVNVGGLVASTLDLKDASLSGNTRTFSGTSSAGVVNDGTIRAASYVALLGQHVSNQGVITAQLGSVALGAGSAATLTFNGNSLVSMKVDQSLLDTLVENGGLIQADGGMVVMSAGAKDALTASVVNNTGVIEARTVENHSGVITLLGAMTTGTVNVSGSLDASAPNGGNGGFIETSAAHVKVANAAKISTIATTGTTGSWLIDPTDYSIAASGGDITGAALSASLANTDVMIQSSAGTLSGSIGTGNVNVNDVVSWSANKLTLNAQNNINVNANLNGSGTASLAFQYGQGALALTNPGTYNVAAVINLESGNNFSTKLGSDGAIVNYKVINSLGVAGSTTGTDLQGINGNLNGYYVLGSNIDATASSAWNTKAGFSPIGNANNWFTGTLDGFGHTVSNLTINGTTSYLALFGDTGATSIIRNIGLVGGSVTGFADVGMLVGYNRGIVANSYATGGVNASTSNTGANSIGGLVGQNDGAGSIISSYATGGVSANVGQATKVGGLVGENDGTINKSYATGNVTGIANNAGGLVGYVSNDTRVTSNHVSINNSYATGNVSGGADVGGLIGNITSFNNTDVNMTTVNNSYATGNVQGGSYIGGLAGAIFSDNRSTTNTNAVITAINDGYATGSVSGTYTGGLVGASQNVSTFNSSNNLTSNPVVNSFWNTTTSGQAASAGGGLGMTTSQMQQQTNFTSATTANGGSFNPGWDFANTWLMYNGQTNPLLRSFFMPLTITVNAASKIYDGLAYTNINAVTYSSPPRSILLGTLSYNTAAIDAGSYSLTVGGLYSLAQQGYLINYAAGTLVVTPAALAITGLTANNKVYDATNTAALSGAAAVAPLARDAVSLTGTATATFATPNIGSSNVSVTGYTLRGTHAGNYLLVEPTLSASITPATLTYIAAPAVHIAGDIPAVLSGSVTGLMGSDTLAGATTGVMAWQTNAAANSLPALYAINGYGLSAQNYIFAQAANNATELTVKPGRAHSPVQNVMTHLEADVLASIITPDADAHRLAPGIAVVQHSGTSKVDTDDASGHAPINTAVGNTAPKFGLEILNGGLKLPLNLVSIND
ncbi:filamentous hemagglutinin N-terminal domain-containing protein [Glaciimonas sp. PAMC28666]|uniref:two-partner secretion domain-containing protein n=1 Tax=Glaciimonas sp. PAMC28666 TaxID=2807626 RepID=UPI0019663F12|nr:filamentous hemagglutinin N-terminal domain-containing protein [Glaciimonas sp. PAMC28666]QRX83423.1 filamentous hemagglutinin N-terminal domain-containing protein [Glaciimonas sp. PAMC28666]